MLWRLIKFLLGLALLCAIGLVVFAYIGPIFWPADFAAPSQTVTTPLVLELE